MPHHGPEYKAKYWTGNRWHHHQSNHKFLPQVVSVRYWTEMMIKKQKSQHQKLTSEKWKSTSGTHTVVWTVWGAKWIWKCLKKQVQKAQNARSPVLCLILVEKSAVKVELRRRQTGRPSIGTGSHLCYILTKNNNLCPTSSSKAEFKSSRLTNPANISRQSCIQVWLLGASDQVYSQNQKRKEGSFIIGQAIFPHRHSSSPKKRTWKLLQGGAQWYKVPGVLEAEWDPLHGKIPWKKT